MKIRTFLSAITLTSLMCSIPSAFAEQHCDHKMKVFKGAQSKDISSLGVDGVDAYLEDVISSNDPKAPITCGFFRMEKGNPLEYTYTYDEAKIIVDGEMTISEAGGETYDVVAGDVVYFDKGAKITFSSKSQGVGFYCGQRAGGEL